MLTLTHGAPGHLVATVAGTTMAAEGSNTDEDMYLLGTLSAGNVVTLNVQLPSTSSWNGMVTVVDASGTPVADTDGNDGRSLPGDDPCDRGVLRGGAAGVELQRPHLCCDGQFHDVGQRGGVCPGAWAATW